MPMLLKALEVLHNVVNYSCLSILVYDFYLAMLGYASTNILTGRSDVQGKVSILRIRSHILNNFIAYTHRQNQRLVLIASYHRFLLDRLKNSFFVRFSSEIRSPWSAELSVCLHLVFSCSRSLIQSTRFVFPRVAEGIVLHLGSFM